MRLVGPRCETICWKFLIHSLHLDEFGHVDLFFERLARTPYGIECLYFILVGLESAAPAGSSCSAPGHELPGRGWGKGAEGGQEVRDAGMAGESLVGG